MEQKNKKEMKQFPLTNKINCIIYLQRIIATAESCLERLKYYNQQTKEILDSYSEKDKIPCSIYSEVEDKAANVMCYLLNILGDSQKTSISYFKYRQQVERLCKKEIEGIAYTSFPDKIQELAQDFNKMRNWQNHIPESLLTAEIEMIKEGKLLPHIQNPIELNQYQYVSIDYMKDLYNSNLHFYEAARKLVQYSKKDYSLLIGESVRISRTYHEKPVSMDFLGPAKLSSKIQGINGNISF